MHVHNMVLLKDKSNVRSTLNYYEFRSQILINSQKLDITSYFFFFFDYCLVMNILARICCIKPYAIEISI